MDKLKIGDVLIMDGKAYISMDKYRSLLDTLHIANELAESFSRRLANIEVANENRKQMRVITFKR